MSLRPAPMLLSLALIGPATAQDAIGPEPPLTPEAVSALESFIAREVEQKGIPALSIALVDDARIVWARGFGSSDPDRAVPATAETVYRVGSVSKLFADLAAMQLVEAGQLDLDAPIADVLPEFAPENPFDTPITLRHLMAHRAGLVREPPVGHYFDPAGPSLAETVASLNETTVLLEPGSKTKYSNAGLGVAGLAVERASGRPFAEAVRVGILGPLGMDSSDFERTDAIESNLADAIMWGYDGRSFEAPGFGLGYAPAGNLYASMPDLGRFLIALFDDGVGPGGPILEAGTLEQMLEPQFDDDGRFGLGFAVGEWEGHRRIGHGGSVYGFATELAALPDEQVGVAVSAALDYADVRLIADLALETLLALKAGEPLPEFPRTEPLPAGLARRLEGRYASEEDADRVVELLDRGDRLLMMPARGGYLHELRAPGDGAPDALVVDGLLLAHGPTIGLGDDSLTIDEQVFTRLPGDGPPPALPDAWDGLIGEYGWDHNVLYILEREGELHALIEWFFLYPLDAIDDDTYAFPPFGLYHDETLAFDRDESGRASRVVLADSVVFGRRAIGGEDGSTFRVVPIRPVSELRPEALAASPPDEAGPFRDADLLDLTTLDPSIKLDVRYATDDNFLGTAFYSSARAFMQRPAAEAVARAHEELAPLGYGLLIHDAYRPWYVTKMFWDATPPASRGFVANPARGSKHNRGCAVDLTLYDLETGEPVPMVAGYDEFSERADPYYLGGTSRQRWHRNLLRRVMEEQGFTVDGAEWWHFDYKDWPSYAIQDRAFEAIDPESPDRSMRTDDFDFPLPDDLIAQRPADRRDQSRLMVVRRDPGSIEHRSFADLPDLLEPGDLLVRNDSRVVPARLVGRREATGGRWEGLYLREHDDGGWELMTQTRGRPLPGEIVVLDGGLRLQLIERLDGGHWLARPIDPRPTLELLDAFGHVPLPPYIRREAEDPADRERYQTVYAAEPGSVAAPTAGLHFTGGVFDRLAGRGVGVVDVTLHVGPGTFRPIKADRIEDHELHSEWAAIAPDVADRLNRARGSGGRVVAVGTTATRVLETCVDPSGSFRPFMGPTRIYLRPGVPVLGVDALVTNFHLPRSSLLVLVSALAGVDLIRAAYAEAVERRYRFYSYGDCMLIL